MRIAIGQPHTRKGDITYNARSIISQLEEAIAKGIPTFLVSHEALVDRQTLQRSLSIQAQSELNSALVALLELSQRIDIILPHEQYEPANTHTTHNYETIIALSNGDTIATGDCRQANSCLHLNIGQNTFLLTNACTAIGTLEREHTNAFTGNPTGKVIITHPRSAFTPEWTEKLRRWGTSISEHYEIPHAMVSWAGVEGHVVQCGKSGLFTPQNRAEQMGIGAGEWRAFDTELLASTPVQTSRVALLHAALVAGLRDFLKNSGLKRATLGLSGGMDSALVLEIATHALGAENVLGVMMPSEYTSEASLSDATLLANRLKTELITIPIDSIRSSIANSLAELFNGKEADTTEENIQARTRGLLLMAISNKLGHAVLNTSNKSEIAVGYNTLYGDMCGAVSVIGDIFKTEVYEMARWINSAGEIIPTRIITRPPSAELRPSQTDQDSLPDYETLDPILRKLAREKLNSDMLVASGKRQETVERILRLVRNSHYKRWQMPPILELHAGNETFSHNLLGDFWPR